MFPWRGAEGDEWEGVGGSEGTNVPLFAPVVVTDGGGSREMRGRGSASAVRAPPTARSYARR